jgi:hypothetical protein
VRGGKQVRLGFVATPDIWRPRLRRLLKYILTGTVALVVLCGLFEFAIRHVPPDGLTFTTVQITQVVNASGQEPPAMRTLDYSVTYDSRRQATISTWYHALNQGQDIGFLPPCNGGPPNGPYYEHTFTFTWHGIPVESATDEARPCGEWLLSSGGLPDLWHFRFLWTTPMQAPNAPPLPPAPPVR